MSNYKEKQKGALKGIGEEDLDGVVSATEMTGLLAPMPETSEEKESYKDIIQFTPTK